MKYKIIEETDTSICVETIFDDGKSIFVTRLKQPPRDCLDREADSIIDCARKQRENEARTP